MNKSQNQVLVRSGKKNKQSMVGNRVGFGLSAQHKEIEERKTKRSGQ